MFMSYHLGISGTYMEWQAEITGTKVEVIQYSCFSECFYYLLFFSKDASLEALRLCPS